MKESGTQPLLAKYRMQKRKLRPLGKMKLLQDCFLSALAALVLAAAKPLQEPLPLAACLICAFQPGLCSVSAALGAVGGYFLFAEGLQSAEPVAMSLLMLAAVLVFQGTELPNKPWFFPLLAAGLWGILRGIGLPGEAGLPLWLLQCGLCGLFTALYRRTVSHDRRAILGAAASVLCALSSLPLPVNAGLLLGSALCLALGTPQAAVAFGLAVDLASPAALCACIAFCVPTLLFQRLRKQNMPLYALGFLGLSCLTYLLFSTQRAAGCAALSAGTAVGLVLHRLPIFSETVEAVTQTAGQTKLRRAASVLRLLRDQLPEEEDRPCVSEAESVYDGAADRVCRCCERFHRCWEARSEETCRDLSSAAAGIITAGRAKVEDFPQSFRDGCCYMEGFVTAVNQELEGMLFRRQYRMRLRESRRIVAQELACLEEFLLSTDEARRSLEKAFDAYLPEVGICSLGRNGAHINGDRCRQFYGRGGLYYILLCDGMGTGEAACRMSGETIELLERILKSGMSAESALKLLNGAELLRGEDRFTTVDLLCIDLKSGQAELMKWGSAASYYRSGEEIKKIGTAAPPPGVGVGGEHVPERYALSLSGGELLVLRSDGACSEEIEEALRSYTGRSPGALAAYLISGISGEDDMTALTVSLRLHISS